MARRINTKFLAVAASVVVALGGGGFVVRKYLIHENPQPFIQAGDLYFKEKDFAKAAENYGHASRILPKDVPLKQRYADSLWNVGDADSVMLASSNWSRELELDPNFTPAMEGLLNWYWRSLSARGDRAEAREYTMVIEMARHLQQAQERDPSHKHGELTLPGEVDRIDSKTVIPVTNLLMWMHNFTMEPAVLNDSMAQIAKQADADPGNAELPLWLGRAKRMMAIEALRNGQEAEAGSLFDEAARVFAKPISIQPDNSHLQLARAMLLENLSQSDPRPGSQGNLKVELRNAMDMAQQLVQPKDPLYTRIKSIWARQLAISDADQAERLLRDLLKERPGDPSLTINLALVIGRQPTRLREAIDLLEALPVYHVPAGLTGPRRDEAFHARGEIALQLIAARLDLMERSSAADQRDDLAKKITQDLDYVRAAFGDLPPALKARARLAHLQDNYRDEIQALTRAMDLSNRPNAPKDFDLYYQLAYAYTSADQTGQARDVLKQALEDPRVNGNPRYHMQLSLLMARVCQKENDVEGIKAQVEYLKSHFPDEAEVVKLQLQLSQTLPPDVTAGLFKRLPETTRGQKIEKANIAVVLGMYDENLRLLKAAVAMNPPDPDVTGRLIQAYAAQGHKDDAVIAVDAARTQFPDDNTIRMLSEALHGANAEQLDKTALGILSNVKDPYAREMYFAQYAQRMNKPDEQLDHLKKARVLQPKAISAVIELSNYYLEHRQYDKAELLLPELAEADADRAHGRMYRFQFALAKHDVQTALTLARELTRDYPEFSKSWEYLGQALEADGQLDDAVAKYGLALEKQATNASALTRLINCSYTLNQFDQARTFIDRGCQLFPDDPKFRDMKINHELRYGDAESVLPAILEAVKTHSEQPQYYLVAGQTLYRAAGVKWAHGERDLANQHLKDAIGIMDQAIAKWPDTPQFYVNKASQASALGDFAGGEAVLKQWGQRPKFKDAPAPLVQLAEYYIQSGKTEQAEVPLREALTRSQNAPELQQRLASVLTSEKKFDQALAVLVDHQDQPIIRDQRVRTLVEAGRLDEARTILTDAIQANPKDSSAYDLLARVYFSNGQFDESLRTVAQALQLNPKDLTATYFRGLNNLHRPGGDVEEAIRDLIDVRDNSVNDVSSRAALADAYLARGDSEAAMKELRAALAIAPGDKSFRVRLAILCMKSVPPSWDEAKRLVDEARAIPMYRDDLELITLQANILAGSGDGQTSQNLIRQAVQQHPGNIGLIQSYFGILMQTKNYKQLQDETDAWVNGAKPTTVIPWWVYNARALARNQLNNRSGALEDFRHSLDGAAATNNSHVVSEVVNAVTSECGPDAALKLVVDRVNTGPNWKLIGASLYYRNGDQANAIKLVEAAMDSWAQLSPTEQLDALRLAGTLYVQQKPPAVDKAITAYEKLLAVTPNDRSALNNLAYLLAEMSTPSQPAKALEYSQRAFDQMQKSGQIDPLVYDTQGWTLILAGRVDDGLDILHQVIDKSTMPELHYHLGEGYLRKNFGEDALRELTVAKNLVDAAIAGQKSVDPALQGKIADALKRAEQMAQAKSQAQANP